ncbi:MAG: HAD family hydrolase [Promethearchaeota archaeon]
MEEISIFIDDGGVISNNTIRGKQWQDLIIEYLIPRYGGEPKAWREANIQVMNKILKNTERMMREKPNLEYKQYQTFEDETWITYMFDYVGLELPPKQDYYKISRDVEAWVTPQIKADIPGIIPAIKKLKSEGYVLHTASGESSFLLKGYLTGMGILNLFNNLYGPDLVGIMKGGPKFYRRIFEHAQIQPSQAIVVDDKPGLLQFAKELGARVIQSCVLTDSVPIHEYYYNDPVELPKLIKSMLMKKS